MRILHTSDWHLGAYVGPQQDNPYDRTENTRECLDVVVKATREESPDIILITGDLFHQSRTWSDRGMIEAQIAIDYIETLASYAPVAILYGTPNHDNLETYKMMEIAFGKDSDEVQFFYTPELREIQTKSGPIQIAALPGFDKGHFRSQYPGLSAEEENKIFSEQLTQIIQGFSAQLSAFMPSVLMAHHTVTGCEMDNGYNVFQANEVTLNTGALNQSGFDLHCLGHVHKKQKIDSFKPIFYAGSIDAYTFNDEGHEKGFYIHKVIDKGSTWEYSMSKFIPTPARKFQTYSFDQGSIEGINQHGLHYMGSTLELQNKVVRVLYSCNSDMEKALDKKKLERDLYAAGAYYVTEIRPENIEASVNRERMHEKMSVEDCLIRYLKEKGYSIPEAEEICNTAVPLIQSAEASVPAGGHVGLFLPLEVEVRNYRSYQTEKIDFTDIYFAMVNGQNGSGKSSLFMDAIADCLYEEPREGELTGWIKTGEKSGSISFTFMLGQDMWRVVRTRQRSGKATLSLTKLENLGEGMSYNKDFEPNWQNHSCQKLVDTQQKIVDLLGMDCSTFQSCVVIMQDKYGIFMEAKPEDRMAILANLLGLGIYDTLEQLAKSKLQDINRDIRQLKEESGELLVSIDQKEPLEADKAAAECDLTELQKQISDTRVTEQDLQKSIDELDRIDNEVSRLSKEAAQLIEIKTAKKQRLDKLSDDAEKTRNFLEGEDFYTGQHNKFVEGTAKLKDMEGKQLLVCEKRKRCKEMQSRADKMHQDIRELKWILENTKDRTLDKLNYESFLKENEDIEERMSAQKETADKHNKLHNQICDLDYSIEQVELKTEWNHSKGAERLEGAKQKATMLESSNCIDPEKAQCRFLADAIEAKSSIPVIEAENADIKKKGLETLETLKAQKATIETSIAELAYNPELTEHLNKIYKTCSDYRTEMAKIEASEVALKVNEERLADLTKQYRELTAACVAVANELRELEGQCDGYFRLIEEIKQLTLVEEKYHKIPAGKEFLQAIEPQIQELSEDIRTLDQDITQKMKATQELTAELTGIDEKKAQINDLKETVKNLEIRISMLNRAIGGIDEKLQIIMANEATLKEKNNSLKELSSKASIMQSLVEAFSQDGIPHQIIRDIIPEIETSANQILSQMTGGWMRVDFKTERTLKSNKNKEVATLDIMTSDAYFGTMPYLSRSGGQKTRINLAVGFALAMVKASRVGLQLGMMFVDEPSWLDDEGTEEYCMALQAIHSKYPEMRIVAISHDASMKMNFPQQIWVELTEEGSKIRRV